MPILGSAYSAAPAPGDVERIVRIVEETLQVPEFSNFAEDLIADVQAFVTAWRSLRTARLRKIRKMVIAAAGWQPRLLSFNRFERTLLPAVDEAVRANILELLVVVPPNTPAFQLLKTTFPGTSITQVVQDDPLGLGNALLAAKDYIEAEPFALLLADEVDESRTSLRDMIDAYDQIHDQIRKPLVAVDAYEPDDDPAVLRYFGFARLGQQVRPHVFALQSQLIEKPRTRPGKDYMRIAGRYVLTPEIMQALQSTHHVEQGPVKHDLTAAINQLWQSSASVLAYTLSHPMLSIAPYKQVIQSMDVRKAFDPATYQRRAERRDRRQRDQQVVMTTSRQI